MQAVARTGTDPAPYSARVAGRVRDVLPHARPIRPFHRPPNPTPIPRITRTIRTHTRRLDQQRRRRTPHLTKTMYHHVPPCTHRGGPRSPVDFAERNLWGRDWLCDTCYVTGSRCGVCVQCGTNFELRSSGPVRLWWGVSPGRAPCSCVKRGGGVRAGS